MVTRRARWSRRASLVAAVALVVFVALEGVRAAPAARFDDRPNVIVVLVDDMGWSDIGPYGGEIPTPSLDTLGRRGVRCTEFYATPRCSPTRASLLTGLYPHQAGMGHVDTVIRPRSSGTTGRINDRSVTIAEVLSEAAERDDLAARRPHLVKSLAAAWDAWAAPANVDSWAGPARLPWGDDAPRAAAVQEPGARRPAADVTSPEIAADRRVTFRLRAPEAKTVKVSGDFGPDSDLQRGGDGVWTTTVGPLSPEMYVYFLIVDGVLMTDPANPRVKIGYVTSTTTSLLSVPGDTPAFYDVQDVPHGEIRTLLYKSRSNGVTRELTVYVPPGYERERSRRYPVLYLLHGFANDHHSWHRYGRANDILDNLIAQKAIAPFLVVMPLGYGSVHVNGDRTGIAPQGADPRGTTALYERDLLEDIIPMIDSSYRTIPDRRQRAIIGFSMGGGQAGRFGLRHLETFSHVGIMSAGIGGGGTAAAAGSDPIAPLAADPAKTNRLIDVLWIA